MDILARNWLKTFFRFILKDQIQLQKNFRIDRRTHSILFTIISIILVIIISTIRNCSTCEQQQSLSITSTYISTINVNVLISTNKQFQF